MWFEPVLASSPVFEWPAPHDVEAWLHPRYFAAFRRGSLRAEWCRREPFEYAILTDFFRPEIVDCIYAHCRDIQLEKARTDGIARHADWYWGAFGCLPVLRFVFGSPFRRFLNELMDADLTMRASSVPQYNVFLPGSRGIPIHTDAEKGAVGVVSLLQLSKGRPSEGGGGELNFYRRISGGGFTVVERIPPVFNTFVLFKVGRNSLHSVADLKRHWTRENIAFDWFHRHEIDHDPS